MKGTYRILQNGLVIAEAENVVTTEGAKLIRRFLAGQSASLGDALAVGVSGSPSALASDVRLNFEIARVPVALKNADFTTGAIIFKGTLPQSDIYSIYELGLWSQYSNALAAGFEARTLTVFNTVVEPWTNVTVDAVNTRTSANSAKITVGSSSTVQIRNVGVSLDLSGYSGNDTFSLAFYKPDNNVSTLKIVFLNSVTGGSLSSAAVAISGLPVGYNIITVAKGSFTSSGTISWSDIDTMGIDATASGTGSYVSVDALRIEDTDTVNKDYALVSHTTSGSVLAAKTAVAPMDIEYSIAVTVT
jgi:hypothetical protein